MNDLQKPTEEQQVIIDAVSSSPESVAIQAYAGCGKTTTLRLIAHALQRHRTLYLAFNRRLCDEASRSLPCPAKTMHSLALSQMIGRYPDIPKLLGPRLNGGTIARLLKINPIVLKNEKEEIVCTIAAEKIGSLVLDTINRFCASDAPEITIRHVPHLLAGGTWGEYTNDIAQYVLMLAKTAWKHMTEFKTWPITHDIYLKKWALTDPYIGADVILFDEAQDANPAFISVLRTQEQYGTQLVWVGDQYQQIYEWRGAINALQRVAAARVFPLTYSFRFGPSIAAQANRILVGRFGDLPMTGAGIARGWKRDRVILGRTNADVLKAAIACVENGVIPRLVGRNGLLALLDDIEALSLRGIPKGQLALFRNMGELIEYAQTEDGRDMQPILDMVAKHGIHELKRLVNRMSDDPRADLTISTIHKAKGMEWDDVRIDATWPPEDKMTDEQWRLLYVAITRARRHVEYAWPGEPPLERLDMLKAEKQEKGYAVGGM